MLLSEGGLTVEVQRFNCAAPFRERLSPETPSRREMTR